MDVDRYPYERALLSRRTTLATTATFTTHRVLCTHAACTP
jgi:hypothetical protein